MKIVRESQDWTELEIWFLFVSNFFLGIAKEIGLNNSVNIGTKYITGRFDAILVNFPLKNFDIRQVKLNPWVQGRCVPEK